jgi:hypothetical protein
LKSSHVEKEEEEEKTRQSTKNHPPEEAIERWSIGSESGFWR